MLDNSPYNDNDVVKLTFESKPTISDYSFKDYQTIKKSKEPLNLGKNKTELFFTVRNLSNAVPPKENHLLRGHFKH